MVNELTLFNYNGSQVRTVVKDGEPWLVAKDVCAVLGINTEQTRRLDADEKGLRLIQTPGGKQELTIIVLTGWLWLNRVSYFHVYPFVHLYFSASVLLPRQSRTSLSSFSSIIAFCQQAFYSSVEIDGRYWEEHPIYLR